MNRILNWDEENGEPLEEWTPNELRNRSTSRTFPIVGGDTLQFYRTLWWIDRLNPSSTSFNRYVNENGLSYSVELIDADDHSRVMLLDTFIIETTTPSKKPCIYSWFPMVSRVSTIIPVAQVSINAYVKINVWTHGTDPLPFVRQDGIKKMLSNYHLSGSAMRNYNDSVEVNINCSGSASCDISVSSSSGPSGLSIGSSFPGNADAFKICTVSGFSVYSSALPLGSNPYFIALNPGLYIVLGLNQGNVVCTRKVIVQ
ncbi:MAG: hypothetical protein HYX66_04050 [Ignavibacteria bacterium]|nr:hypothetical protein [Ignavibacteria bacterium]